MNRKVLISVMLMFLGLPVFMGSCNKNGGGDMPQEKKFWEWFSKHSQELLADSDGKGEIVDEMYRELQKVGDLAYEFSLSDDGAAKREFIISADGNPDLIECVERLYDARPNLPGWEIVKYRPRMECNYSVCVGDVTIDPDTARFSLFRSEDNPGMLDVVLFIDDYSEDNTEQQNIAAFVLVNMLLGEWDIMQYVDVVEAIDKDSELCENSHPISELTSTFDEWKNRALK